MSLEMLMMIVGHLPRELSRPTRYLLDPGMIVTATITSEHYWESPLFQGRLEIRCVITFAMIATVCGHLLLQSFEQFVKTLFAELKDEVIVGYYLTKANLSIVQANDRVVQRKRNITQGTMVKNKDIRDMLEK